MKHDEPAHWLNGADPELAQLLSEGLQQARAQGLSPAGRARLLRRLNGELDAETTAQTKATVADPTPTSGNARSKQLLVLLALAGAATLWFNRPADDAMVEPQVSNADPQPHAPARPTPDSAARTPAIVLPEQEKTKPAAAPPVRPTPRAAAVVRDKRTPIRHDTAKRQDGPSELQLIRDAHRHLRVQPMVALGYLERHARAYPEGVLVQEREVLRIEALLRSGQQDAAQQRAAAFLAQYGQSTHARRVRELLQRQAAINAAINANNKETP